MIYEFGVKVDGTHYTFVPFDLPEIAIEADGDMDSALEVLDAWLDKAIAQNVLPEPSANNDIADYDCIVRQYL